MDTFLADFIGHPMRGDFVEVFWIQIWIQKFFGPPGSGSVIICTDLDPDYPSVPIEAADTVIIKPFQDMVEDTNQFISAHLDTVRNKVRL
jgi:hypothetical protein